MSHGYPSSDRADRLSESHRYSRPRFHSPIVPRLPQSTRSSSRSSASSFSQLPALVGDMADPNRIYPADLDGSSYDFLSDSVSDVISDDDARTESLSSTDESEASRMSDFRYDSDIDGTEEEVDVVTTTIEAGDDRQDGAESVHTASDQSDDDDISDGEAEGMLNSTLSELATEVPSAAASMHDATPSAAPESQCLRYDDSRFNKLRMHHHADNRNCVHSQDVIKTILGLGLFLFFFLFSAAITDVLVGYNITRPSFNPPPTVIANVPQGVATNAIMTQNDATALASEQSGQVLQLTGVAALSSWASEKGRVMEELVSCITSKSPSALLVPESVQTPPLPNNNNAPLHTPQSRFPSYGKLREVKAAMTQERFYVYLNSGQVLPLTDGRREKHADRMGPYTQLAKDNEKFRISFNARHGKFVIARVHSAKIKGSTAIAISREGRVIQRGYLTTAEALVSWVPKEIAPEELYGDMDVLFVLPAESAFQTSSINLGSRQFQWSDPPMAAAAAASDVMRRITDAISTYVEPRMEPPAWMRVATKPPIKKASEDAMQELKAALGLLKSRAMAMANQYTKVHHLPTLSTMLDKCKCGGERKGRTGAHMAMCNHMATVGDHFAQAMASLSTLPSGAIAVVNGRPRKQLALAQDRVKKLQCKYAYAKPEARSCQKSRKSRKSNR
jgi:hypothetical protein